MGITLASVATLVIAFAAILVFYFYRHRKLKMSEDSQKRKARHRGIRNPDTTTSTSRMPVINVQRPGWLPSHCGGQDPFSACVSVTLSP